MPAIWNWDDTINFEQNIEVYGKRAIKNPVLVQKGAEEKNKEHSNWNTIGTYATECKET